MAGVNQSTSGGTNETPEGQNALDMDAAEINKFAGEAYEDGKPVSTQTPKNGKEAAAKPQTPAQKAAAIAAAKDEDGDEGTDDNAAEVKTHKTDKTIQQRINIAVGKQRQAERDRDAANTRYSALEARLAKLEGGGQTPAQKAQTAKDPNAEPDPKDFPYGEADEAYIRAVARYEVRQELKDQQESGKKEQLTAAQKAENEATKAAIGKFFEAGAKKFGDDYQEKVSDENIKISPTLVKLLLDSDNGVDIAFDITADADLAKKVSAMTPERQAAWFGSYEDQHYSSDTADADEEDDEGEKPEVKTPSKPVSRAPKPPVHKNRGGGSSEAVTAATSDFAAFERMATKQR